MKISIIDDDKTKAELLALAIEEHLFGRCSPCFEIISTKEDFDSLNAEQSYLAADLIIIDQHLYGGLEGLSVARKWLDSMYSGQIIVWTGDLSVADDKVKCVSKADDRLFEIIDSLINDSDEALFDENSCY